jgi:hypothetical protein
VLAQRDMNQLYPIIRRKRRPLVEPDATSIQTEPAELKVTTSFVELPPANKNEIDLPKINRKSPAAG